MNQRYDDQSHGRADRDRTQQERESRSQESGRDFSRGGSFYPGNHGFQDSTHTGHGGHGQQASYGQPGYGQGYGQYSPIQYGQSGQYSGQGSPYGQQQGQREYDPTRGSYGQYGSQYGSDYWRS